MMIRLFYNPVESHSALTVPRYRSGHLYFTVRNSSTARRSELENRNMHQAQRLSGQRPTRHSGRV